MSPDFQTPSEVFPIVPSRARTFAFIAFVLVVCLIPVAATAPLFSRAPVVAVAWVAALGAGAVVSYVGWSSRHVRFELSPAGLRVRNSLFGRAVPRADLLPEQGRAVSLRDEPRFKPVLRTWGSGLVGYREGWFRLRNWDKALLFLTDPTRLVDLPTRQGYRLLLSVEDPQQFLAAARQIWGAAPPASPFAVDSPAPIAPLAPR